MKNHHQISLVLSLLAVVLAAVAVLLIPNRDTHVALPDTMGRCDQQAKDYSTLGLGKQVDLYSACMRFSKTSGADED